MSDHSWPTEQELDEEFCRQIAAEFPVNESEATIKDEVAEDDGHRLSIVSLDEFVAVDEPGAEPLVGEADDVVIGESSDVMMYGDGGAGKTTLAIDGAFHLAAGDDWLGIRVARTLRVLLIENEGPRPLYRKKLKRKRAAWTGSPVGERIRVLDRPWGRLSLADEGWRNALAARIENQAIDLVIAGPVTRLGMNEAGTLQEVRDFMALVDEVRARSGRGVAVLLIHHENKGGKVSGAWEGSGDTLIHVTGQGHGKLRLYFQKARWSSTYHATTMQLRWAEGESFAVEDVVELDDDAIAEKVIEAVAADPGTKWTAVEKATRPIDKDRLRRVRDDLLRERRIVNVGKDESGVEVVLDHVPEKKRARLYPPDDPTIAHLRRGDGSDAAQSEPLWAAGDDASAPLRPSVRRAQLRRSADEPPPSDHDTEEQAARAAGEEDR